MSARFCTSAQTPAWACVHLHRSVLPQEVPGLRLQEAVEVIRTNQRFVLRTLDRGALALVAFLSQFIHASLEARIGRETDERGRVHD